MKKNEFAEKIITVMFSNFGRSICKILKKPIPEDKDSGGYFSIKITGDELMELPWEIQKIVVLKATTLGANIERFTDYLQEHMPEFYEQYKGIYKLTDAYVEFACKSAKDTNEKNN